jgi:ribosomal protein S18 acetylase RimI-like enzyme
MSVVARQMAGEADYARARRMLIAYVASGNEYHYATVGDLDWWRFTSNDPAPLGAARIWLAGDEAIGVAWPGGDQVDLLVHPDHRDIEDAMLDWAEARHRERHAGEGETPPFTTYTFDGDTGRVARLQRRGYERDAYCYRYRRRPLDGPLAAPTLPPGYTLRHVMGEADLEARVNVHRAAFAPSKMTAAKHRAVMAAPTYRPELDLVAVAPDGRFASYCIAWYDDVNRIGVFEPVGTDPAFQRRGLSKAVLTEGLRRLQRLGARIAYVNTNGDNVAANPLYEAVGFRVVGEYHAWKKAF